MSLLETENWESGKVYRTDSGDMVRSKQERFVANLLTSEGISFEYERELSSRDGSSRYPDFTLFIKGKQYYWEHWGMVDDYSYRQYIAKKIRWYRKHGYYEYLIQTWGGGDRNLRGQVLAKLSELGKRKRRKRAYKSVFRLRKPKGKKRGWIIPLALILALLFLGAFFSSLEVPAPVTKSEVPEAISRKREPEKELQAVKRPHLIAEEVQAEESAMEKKEKTEVFYMGIKISR